MLKTSPQDFRAGVIAATASDKTTQLGNPLDDLRKRGRLWRWMRDAMDGTIQCLPFFWVQQDAPGGLGHRTRQHGGVQNPPRQDAVERQTATQALCRRPLACFHAATALQNPMPDLDVIVTSHKIRMVRPSRVALLQMSLSRLNHWLPRGKTNPALWWAQQMSHTRSQPPTFY